MPRHQLSKKQIQAARDRLLPRRFNRYKAKVLKSGKCFELTLQDVEAILAEDCCNYCGSSLPKVGIGLDRIDNTKGYTKDNVSPCCSKCNKMKSDLTIKDFYKHLRKIIKYAKKSKTS